MIRNKQARDLIRAHRGLSDSALAEKQIERVVSHVIVARAGTGSLPYRTGWRRMRAQQVQLAS